MEIEASIESLTYEAAFYAAGIEGCDPSSAGLLAERASATFRVLASMVLLARADHDDYAHHLTRSACARAAFLARPPAADEGYYRRCASRSIPALEDALAAQAWVVAAEVAAGTPRTWFQRNEYESDFRYALALIAVLSKSDGEATQAALAAYARALDGSADPTLGVLTAIADQDQPAFDVAFDALVLAHDERNQADRQRGEIEDEATFSRRHLDIPGLALLRLAEFRGLTAQERPPRCPAVALLPLRVPYVRDL